MAFGFGKKKQQAADLMATGAKAVGTVISVQDTGMTVNDDPRVMMVFKIEPLDGSTPFQAEKKKVISRVSIPRSGERYPVWYDINDPETWAFATIADESGKAQIRQLFGEQIANTLTGFADASAAAAAPAAEDPLETLKKLDQLRDSGVITDAEFEQKKAQILASM